MSKPLRVLIVEDSENDALLLIQALKRGGYTPTYERVYTPTNLRTALDTQAWDVVITDYMMPSFSAPAALRTVKESGHDLPFIIVSGAIGENTAVEAMRAGAHDYIMKDNLARLVPAIEREMQEAENRAERRRAEELSGRLGRLLDSASNEIYVFDIETLCFTQANRGAQRNLGFTHDELLRLSLLSIQPDLTESVLRHYLQPLQSGDVEQVMYETEQRRKDGTQYSVEVQLQFSEAENPPVFLAIVQDITLRKQAEESLRESEARFRMMADTAPVHIWMAGADQQFTYFNKRWLGFTGQTLETSLGYTWADRLHPQDREQYFAAYDSAFTERREFSVEYRLRRHDGEYCWFMSQGAPRFLADGTFVGYIGSCIDITRRKAAEEETRAFAARIERSNRELQDFAYIASHDLQEPLRKILVFGNRLLSKYGNTLDDDGKDYLQRMQSAAQRMQNLISDLLKYSRISTQAHAFETIDLNTVIKDVLDDLDVRLEQSQGCVETGDLPNIEGDPVQIRQLFQNVISNALKYHRPEVPPVVKVSCEMIHTDHQPMYQLVIEDNGIGFEPEYGDRIFGFFQRLHGRSEYEGNGMGLAICRKIVERHQGSITATSVPGEGSRFLITLPAQQKDMVKA